ncbi:hypothetical protein D3C81_1667340 [compost metagenome]
MMPGSYSWPLLTVKYVWKICGENTYESTSGLNRIVETKYGVVLRPSLTVP